MTDHTTVPSRVRRGLTHATGSCLLALSAAPALAHPGPEPHGPGISGPLPTIAVTPLRATPAPAAVPEAFSTPTTTITWGGFIKVDAIYSDFSKGDSLSPAGRDFFVPSSIPVGAEGNHETSLDFHAKETRLFIKAETDIGGAKIGGYVEFDFLVNQGTATPNVTNAYNPGLRRAFLTYENWLVGQDWTTFQDLNALPEGLDFIGPTEGTVFGRQPMLRYTSGNLQLALENAESVVLSQAETGTVTALSNDNVLPDVVARYYFKGDWGQIAIAGLARQLRSDVAPVDDDVIGGGLSLTGKIALFGEDDLRFGVTTGEGIGRYVGINTIADAAVQPDSTLDAIGLAAGYLTYRHVWSPEWRSNFTVSGLKADTTEAMGAGATRRVHSVHANLLVSPFQKTTLGVELMHAEREVQSGLTGELQRLQFSAKYSF